jgi:GT2 family glycosyltransferase
VASDDATDIIVSVVIVHYKVPQLLLQTLRSLRDADGFDRCEVIVVDNHSQDYAAELTAAEFPAVKWIGLKSNIGFGKASNVGAQAARGSFVLFLNPDTLVSKNTIVSCVDFMADHADAGIVGPRILNADGTLQKSCRRSFPTPGVAFYHLSGLSQLFPRSRRFGRYNLTFMDPNEAAPVDAVSGSFMFMRHSLFQKIGGFDERFFMYGEDLDLCRQVHDCGYTVWYNPATQIIHFKGKSSARRPLRSRMAFYEAWVLFSRKYRHTNAVYFPGWLIFIGIAVFSGINLGASLVRSLRAALIDLAFVNILVWISVSLRFLFDLRRSPYESGGLWIMLVLHVLISACFLASFVGRGVYATGRFSARNTLVSGFVASVMFMAVVYFVPSMAFSRIAFAISAVVTTFALAGWREVAWRITPRLMRFIFATGNVIIVGDGPVAGQLIENMEKDRSARITGIIWPRREKAPGALSGYPVLGLITDTRTVLERQRTDLLLIATAEPWYSFVIEALASPRVNNLTVRWVPHELLTGQLERLPGVIPLQDFRV